MNNVRESVGLYWVLFIISAIVIVLLLIFIRPYFWMALPFVVTTFSKALRII